MRKLVALLLCLTTVATADRTYFLPGYDQPDWYCEETPCQPACTNTCNDTCAKPWYTYVEGRGRYGDFRQGGGGDLFVPWVQNESGLVFTQTRAYRLKHQSNFSQGVGFRKFCGPGVAWGLNGWFDYTRTDRHHSYYQGGVGAEVLGECWEARANAYIPNRSHRRNVGSAVLQDAFLRGINVVGNFLEREERSYPGLDAEIGYIIPVGCGYLRTYAGGFWFRSECTKDLVGPRVRAMYEWDNPICCCGTRLFVGGEFQFDAVRRYEGGVVGGFRIPLGGKAPCCYKSSLCRRMGDLVHREFGVITTERTVEVVQPIVGPAGNDLLLLFVDAIGGGPGTQIAPTTIEQAEAISGPNDIIIGLADEGNIQIGQFVFKNVQQLLGFDDQTSIVADYHNGVSFVIDDLTLSGRATFAGVAGLDQFILADDNNIFGLRFINAGRSLVGNMITNTIGADLIFDNVTSAIDVRNSQGLVFYDQLMITNTSSNAMHFATNSAAIALEEITIDTVAFNGLNLMGNTGGVSLIGGEFSNLSRGVNIDSQIGGVDLTRLNIDQVSDTALFVSGTSGGLLYTTGQITNVATGIDIRTSTNTSLFAGVSIDRVSTVGINLANNTGSFTFEDGAVTTAVGPAQVVTYDAGGLFAFNNVQVASFDGLTAGTNGFEFFNPNGGIFFNGTTIQEVGAAVGSANAVINVTSTGDTFTFGSLDTTVRNGTAAATNGYDFDIAGASTATIEVINGTVKGVATGINFAPTAAAGSDLTLGVMGSTIESTGNAIAYFSNGDNSGLVVDFDYSGNTIDVGSTAVIFVPISANTGSREFVTGVADDNTITGSAGIVVIPLFNTNAMDFLGMGVEDNTFVGVTGISVNMLHAGSGIFDPFVSGNTDMSLSATAPYQVDNLGLGAATKQTCATLFDNDTDRAAGITVTRAVSPAAGTLRVPGATSAAALSAVNNGIPTVLSGTILSTACPPPPAPPV